LACVYEILTTIWSDIYNSICPDSQAALKALQPVKTMVRQCQRVLDDLYSHDSMIHLGPQTFWCNCKWNQQ